MEGVTAGPNQINSSQNSKVTQPDLAKEDLTIEILEVDQEQIEKNECVICMDQPKDTVFYPCGHQCLCKPCGDRFRKEARHQICPICRNRVSDIIKVFN
jgi:hypothetical protein